MTYAPAEFLPERIVVDLGRDVQAPAVDAAPDPMLGNTEEEFTHRRDAGVEFRQGRQVPPAAIPNGRQAILMLQQPMLMGRGIRAPVFFRLEALGVEVKPVLVRRTVAAFQHVVKLPEAAETMVEDTVENDAHILFVRLLEQFVECRLPAQQGVDAEKIKGMVTVVGSRGENRIQIEGGDAQIFEIIQLFCDAVQVPPLSRARWEGIPRLEQQVPCGIACAFCETIRKNLIKNRVLYPVWRCH